MEFSSIDRLEADNLKSFNLFMILDSLYKLIEKSSIIRFFKFNFKLLEGLSESDLILLRNI